jgi:heterodisulfide reductase subunit D
MQPSSGVHRQKCAPSQGGTGLGRSSSAGAEAIGEDNLASSEPLVLTGIDRDPGFVDALWAGGGLLRRCIQCGTCSASCPTAYAMDYPPRQLWRLAALGLAEEVLSSRSFWLCTVCQSCQVRCPRGINITEAMVALKEYATRRGAAVPERLQALAATVTTHHNISGDDNASRLIWSENLADPPPGVRETLTQAETVYFVGCVGAFYPRAYSIPQALVQLLGRAGTEFTTLGGAEQCCGYPLYVAGAREAMGELARHNVERVRELGARRVIFTCPSCYYAWSHLYPEMVDVSGLELQHATEFLVDTLDGADLPLGPVEAVVTYHDPCDLGRKNGVYDAPRELLARIPGLELREMAMARESAVCCGGGGDVETADPEVTQGVAAKRLAQVEATGAEYVVSACQQCKRTLQEAARQNRVRVRAADVVELLWRSVQAAEGE